MFLNVTEAFLVLPSEWPKALGLIGQPHKIKQSPEQRYLYLILKWNSFWDLVAMLKRYQPGSSRICLYLVFCGY